MKAPLVSVIVPNYNHAPYLRQRFDSIFGQTFQDFEVIILDDCSTDNSKEIIEEYRNRPQISHIVYNETNSGSPFKQWTKGFELAQGEYIWIAESDDWAELNFLEKILFLLSQNHQIAIAFCTSIKEYPNKTSTFFFFKDNTIIDGISFIKKYMPFSNAICNASSVIFKKRTLSHTQSDFTNYRSSGDYRLWISMCEQGQILYIRDALNHFRQHTNNTTSQNTSSGKIFLEEYDIFQYMVSKKYLSKFLQRFIVAFKLSSLRTLTKQNILNEKCDVKKIQTVWASSDDSNIVQKKMHAFILSALILLLKSPVKKTVLFFFPWMTYFENINTTQIIWNLCNFPNTNIRKKIRKNAL